MTLFLCHILISFMKKEPCANFRGVLMRFHEVIKLQSLEFDVSDVIPMNSQNLSPLVFFAFFWLILIEKKPPIKLPNS